MNGLSVTDGMTHISTMPSGRLAGISVRPFLLQSTMLLLQEQLAGQTDAWGAQDLGSDWEGPGGPGNVRKIRESSRKISFTDRHGKKNRGNV